MKFALVQYAPHKTNIEANMQTVEALLAEKIVNTITIDAIVLPELGLHGYIFANQDDHVKNLAEEFDKGKIATWCKNLAIKYSACVFCGFIESKDANFYDSMLLVNKQGQCVQSYQKHLLFEDDKRWGKAGNGYQTCMMSDLSAVPLALAICQDINCDDWKQIKNDDSKHLAKYVKSLPQQPECMFFISTVEQFGKKERYPVHQQEHWKMRLSPLFGTGMIFCGVNRTGTEEGLNKKQASFCGSSCIWKLDSEPKLLCSFGADEIGVKICDTANDKPIVRQEPKQQQYHHHSNRNHSPKRSYDSNRSYRTHHHNRSDGESRKRYRSASPDSDRHSKRSKYYK